MTPTLLALACALMPPPAPDTSFLRQYAQTRGYMLGRPAKIKIAPDGKTVFFLRSGPTDPAQSLFAFDVATKQTAELLTAAKLLGGAAEELSAEEKARRERQRVSAGGFADYHLSPDGARVLVSLSGRLFVFDLAAKAAAKLKTGPGAIDPKWSPDGTKVGYVRGFDVYCFDIAAGKETAVTAGGTREKTHGLAEFVAQEEMGRHTGYWWSPDSKRIAYTEADHAGVEVWHIADPFKPDASPAPQFYPRPGKKNVTVRLGIVDIGGGKTVWVEWDRAKYEYLAAVKWGHIEDEAIGRLTLLLQDRKQQRQSLLLVDAQTGSTKQLLGESDSVFVNIPAEVPMPSCNTRGFFWLTTRDGRLELQKRNSDGTFGEVALHGEENIVDVIGSVDWHPKPAAQGAAVGCHVAPDPTQKQVRLKILETVLINPGSEGNLTTELGVHTGTFGQTDYPHVITSTTLKQLPDSVVFARDGKLGPLPSVALAPPFTPNVTVAKVDDYWTAVVRPRDFDPAKKYPVIVDVYGGPRHLHVVQAMRNWLIPQWLADQGFVVAAVDNRGTPGRGRDWERAVYQKFGTVPLEDQVKGLQALAAKHPELDLGRVGIVGWSFGGYMAANAVLRRPDVFHAAVAGAPVTDWEDYDTHYTERYMGLLPESRKAYDEASLIPLAKDLRRPLLLVHGTADDNVYYRHSLKLADALFRAGKPFEMLPLPGVTHMYTADPAATERLWERSVTFFRQHLGGPK